MRAVRCEGFGKPSALRVSNIAVPVPGPGEVAIDVVAVGLGYVDGLLVRGLHQTTAATVLPYIPGNEISGRIGAVGEGVDPARIGESVMALGHSGLADRAVLRADLCLPIPDGLSFEMAAGAVASYATNVFAFETCGALKAREVVLVLGASGGVGSAAVDLAKGLGAIVVACASSSEKLAAAKARGADLLIDYSVPNWRDALRTGLGGRLVDVVYDPVGGAYSETAFRCLGPGGRHLVVGFASGQIPKLPLNLALVKRCSLVGVDLGGYIRVDAKRIVPMLQRFLDLYAEGQVHPEQPTVHPLDGAGTVLQDLLERRVIGKQVIRVAA
jgi:NADPH2:quinone reductase